MLTGWLADRVGSVRIATFPTSEPLMPLDYEKLMRTQFEPTRQSYTRRDTMLYALGLGVGTQDPVDWNGLKYVYE